MGTPALLTTLLILLTTAVVCYAEVRTVRLEAYYPRPLSSLYLRGNDRCGLSWAQGKRMTPSVAENFRNTGERAYVWSIDLACEVDLSESVSASVLEVKALVDDNHWMLGANHHFTFLAHSHSNNNKQNTLSGAGNNLTETHLSTGNVDFVDGFFPWFYSCKGSLSVVDRVYSQELKNFRDVIFYLPPSYAENTLKAHRNVLVMHDGQNLFNHATAAFGTAWMCQETLDRLIIDGSMDEVLVVGPYNTDDRMNEYTYVYDSTYEFGGKGDLYLNWIESTLLPLTQKNFRVDITRDSLGLLGSSLGGLISCYAGWTRAKVYGKVGCMSSSFFWADQDFQKNILVNQEIDRSLSLPVFYMDSGTNGEDLSPVHTTQVYEYLQTKGFTANKDLFKYIDVGASHNEASWGARFYIPMQDLYPSSTV